MKVNVSPVAVGATQPQPGVEGLRRHRLTADRVQRLRGTDVGDVRRASFVVEDAYARINDVEAAAVLSRRLGLRRGVVEVKPLEGLAFCALSQLHTHTHPSGRTVASPFPSNRHHRSNGDRLEVKKGKGFPYSIPSVGPGADPGVQAVSLQVTVSHPPGGRLPLLSARPAVTSPAAEHYRPLAGTKLYCLVTKGT